MAATALLSCHSSNPFEVASSDPRHRAFLSVRMDVDALSRDFPTDDAPSDNSPHDHDLPHMDQYLVQLHPNSASTSYQYGPSTSKTTLDAPSQVITAEHVDDEMLSDEDAEADEDMEEVEDEVEQGQAREQAARSRSVSFYTRL